MDYIKFVEPELFSYTIYEDGTITKYDNTEISGSVGKHGYYEFGTNSTFSKILKIRLKHRVIAHALFGDITGKEVDHIDRNRANNHPDNLRLLSSLDNMRHSVGRLGVDTETHKLCSRCKIVLPRSSFGHNSATPDKLSAACKPCRNGVKPCL